MNNRGFSLLEMVIASAIMAGVVLFSASSLTALLRNSNVLENKVGHIEVRESLLTAIDCDNTLTAAVLSACGGYIELKNKSNVRITGPLESRGAYLGSGTYGAFIVRARCDAAARTLVVEGAKPGPNNGFSLDPISKVPLDFNNPKRNPIFGPSNPGSGAVPMCQSKFNPGGAPNLTCSVGQVVSGFDAAGNVVCTTQGGNRQTQTCPTGQVVSAIRADGALTCRPPGGPEFAQSALASINFLMGQVGQCGSLAYPRPGFVNAHYFGEAICPRGMIALGGGVDCQMPGALGGTTQATRVMGDRYAADCCMVVQGTTDAAGNIITASPGSFPNAVSATCIRYQ